MRTESTHNLSNSNQNSQMDMLFGEPHSGEAEN